MTYKYVNIHKDFKNCTNSVLALLWALKTTAVDGIPVATFQADGEYRVDSYLRYKLPLGTADSPLLANFTLCMWTKLFRLRGFTNRIASYANADSDNALTASKSEYQLSTIGTEV